MKKSISFVMLLMVIVSALPALQLSLEKNAVPYDIPKGQHDQVQVSCSIWGISYSESMLEPLRLNDDQYRKFRMLERRFEQRRIHLNRMIDQYQKEIDGYVIGKSYSRIEELEYLIERTRSDIIRNWSDFNVEVVRMLNARQGQIWTNMITQVCGAAI